jgi:hypothetical protein
MSMPSLRALAHDFFSPGEMLGIKALLASAATKRPDCFG